MLEVARSMIYGNLACKKQWLIGLDRDGTLAPIVDDPERALIPGATNKIVVALAVQPETTVAIVSARCLRQLCLDFHNTNAVLCGNYGMEMVLPGSRYPNKTCATGQVSLDKLRSHIKRLTGEVNGIIVDDHGLSICVHWHAVPEESRQIVHMRLSEFMSDVHDLKLVPLPTSHEILPNLIWDKGMAMAEIAESLKLNTKVLGAVFIGDSDADEPAFEWVNEIGGLSVRVGKAKETTARLTINAQSDVEALLSLLLAVRESWVVSPKLVGC